MTASLATVVSVGKRGKSRRVYDAFVEDESVAFNACDDPKMFGVRLPAEEVRVGHIDIASLVQRLRDFVNQVLAHDVIAQLLGATNVEGEASHFAADLALTGLVAIIFGTCRREFCDDVPIIEFVCHFSQVIA